MVYIMFMLLMGVIVGMSAVASNPSPYFAALGLVLVAGVGCGILVGHGGSFLSLVLFLIYLGGMLVVFAYSAALAAEPYPEDWGSKPVLEGMGMYMVAVAAWAPAFQGGWYEGGWMSVDESHELFVLRADLSGVAMMYSGGGGVLVVTAWVLLLTLFVVLDLTRGADRGTLRAV